MPHRGSARRDDEDDELDSDDEEEAEEPEHPRRSSHRRPAGRPAPVRRWRGPGEKGGKKEDEPERPPSRRTVFWRARDSLYFEPLVALAVIVVLLVGLFAYTQNWPPIYVVESDSMQHGSTDILGLINTGDLVLAQKVSNGSIVPYMVGLASGYSTYGEFGDVLLYQPNGGGGTPIIHRAILFLDWNSATSSYSAPDLQGLPCGTASNAVYAYAATSGGPVNCDTSDLTGTLYLYHVGWRSLNVSVSLSSSGLGEHSGYLTMGDNNYIPDQSGSSATALSALVEPGWIIGVARGMIPWFGAVKLLLEGQAGMVPSQSWEFLGLTIAGVILLAFGIHYALRWEGVESPLRRREEEEAREARGLEDEDAEEGRGSRWLKALRPWRRESDEDEEDEGEPARKGRTTHEKTATASRRGRPRPRVRRHDKRPPASEDDEL